MSILDPTADTILLLVADATLQKPSQTCKTRNRTTKQTYIPAVFFGTKYRQMYYSNSSKWHEIITKSNHERDTTTNSKLSHDDRYTSTESRHDIHDTTFTNDIMKDNEISTTDNPQPLSAHGMFIFRLDICMGPCFDEFMNGVTTFTEITRATKGNHLCTQIRAIR